MSSPLLLLAAFLLSCLPVLQALPKPQTGGPDAVKSTREGGYHRALWRTNGPTCNEITQTLVSDCFLAATFEALCVLADRFPAWLQSAVKVVDPANATNGQIVDTAEFNLFNTQPYTSSSPSTNVTEWTWTPTNQNHWQSMNYANDVIGGANDNTPQYASTDMQSTWWVPGFQNAAAKLFGKDYLDGGWPSQAMVMLANQAAVSDFGLSQDDAYDLLSHASDAAVTLSTQTKAKKLVTNHAYGVFSTRMNGDTQMVTLRNPWGPTTEYNLSEIMPDIEQINYLENWFKLTPP